MVPREPAGLPQKTSIFYMQSVAADFSNCLPRLADLSGN